MISFLVHFVRQHFLIIICCVVTAFLWPNLRKNIVTEFTPAEDTQSMKSQTDHKLFTVEELALFDGVNNKQLYLSILGSVFDVSKGARHYGVDGSYNYFVGKIKRYV